MTRSRPQTGQWCIPYMTSARSPHRSIVCSRYFDHAIGSRILAPRIVYVLCSVWQQFSAAVTALNCSMNQCISDGASLSGAIMNSKSSPAMDIRCPVSPMMSVGGIRPIAPDEVDMPRPAPTWPRASAGSRLPYM